MQIDAGYAQQLDAADPLAGFRDKFVIDDPVLIYLDGNSMGRMPKATSALLADVQATWSKRLIRSWAEKYFYIGQESGAKIAKLIGAQPDEVIVAESTTVNLFKLATAALRAQVGRTKIVTDDLNFPSDIYALEGICDLLGAGHEIEVVASPNGVDGPVARLAAALDDETALLTLSHTVFKSAYIYDMAAVTKLAHDAGALTLWDLSHAAGSMPIHLNDSHADLAIGCTYKYLNGGPGSNAFLYVRRDLQERLNNPIQGWMSQQNQFDFDYTYKAMGGIGKFLTGTPNVLSIAPIGVGADLLAEAGMDSVRRKSVAQTEYLIALWRELLEPLGFTLNSPQNAARRGSHVSFGHVEGWRITQCMIQEMQIIPDFRAPDNIRLGITPLYTTFGEIHETVMRMKQIVEEKLYEKYSVAVESVVT